MIKVKTVCNKCEWYYYMAYSFAVCKEPSVVKQDPVTGKPLYKGCRSINSNGDCKLYEELPKKIEHPAIVLIGTLVVAVAVIVIVALALL